MAAPAARAPVTAPQAGRGRSASGSSAAMAACQAGRAPAPAHGARHATMAELVSTALAFAPEAGGGCTASSSTALDGYPWSRTCTGSSTCWPVCDPACPDGAMFMANNVCQCPCVGAGTGRVPLRCMGSSLPAWVGCGSNHAARCLSLLGAWRARPGPAEPWLVLASRTT
jgi:hypothetical protein